MEVVYHLCLDFSIVLDFVLVILFWGTVTTLCVCTLLYFVHVVVLYIEIRCCDDLHEVTPLRFRLGEV